MIKSTEKKKCRYNVTNVTKKSISLLDVDKRGRKKKIDKSRLSTR